MTAMSVITNNNMRKFMDATWTNILWFMVIGALFFMMMRKGGCCGGHRQKEQKQKVNEHKVDHK